MPNSWFPKTPQSAHKTNGIVKPPEGWGNQNWKSDLGYEGLKVVLNFSGKH